MVVFGDPRLPARMWARLHVDTATQCWLWSGAADRKGYGRIGRGRRVDGTTGVHVWMTEVAHGPKPSPRHMALHSCDTPACANPSHLRWGLARENSADMVNRGRSTRKAECIRGHPRTPENLYACGACKPCALQRAATRRRK